MVVLVAMLGCGEEGTTSAPAPADPHAGHEMPAQPGNHGDHGVNGGHELHGANSEHMTQMVAHRDALRAELGEAYDAPVPGLDQADPERGRPLYEQQCVSCHGAAGKGDGPMGQALQPPAADFTDAFHARFYSDAARVHIIRKGIPNTAMVGFESALSPEQLLDVYAYVRIFREKK